MLILLDKCQKFCDWLRLLKFTHFEETIGAFQLTYYDIRILVS